MAQYGRRLYYEILTGKIIQDTGEMEGCVMQPSSIDEEVKMFGFEDSFKKTIDVIELPFGFYREYGSEDCNFIRINHDKKALQFYKSRHYHDQFYDSQRVKKAYTEEELYKFYYEHYIYNLQQLYKAQDPTFKFVWKTLDELNIRSDILSKSWFHYFDDNYLIESARDKTQLARDVLANGTYWPLVIGKYPEFNDDKLYIFEGNHRILSAKLLQFEGEWDNDKKMLCIQVDDDYYNKKQTNKRTLEELETLRMNNSIMVRMPYILRYNELPVDDKFVMNDLNAFNIKTIDTDTIEFEVEYYNEYISAVQSYPHWLRDLFYNYKQENGKIIIPSKIINDETKFNEWVATF